MDSRTDASGDSPQATDGGAATVEIGSDLQQRDQATGIFSGEDDEVALDLNSEVPDDGQLSRIDRALHLSAPTQPLKGQDRSSGRTSPYRQQDAELVKRLRINRFSGPEYDRFKEKLITYGLGICNAWIRSRVMHAKCADSGRPVDEFPVDGTNDDARDLAAETAVNAAEEFRKVALVEGRWDPSRGAALTTYYIGMCVLVYPNVYRRWLRQRRRDNASSNVAFALNPVDSGNDIETMVLGDIEVAALMEGIPEPGRSILQLKAKGYANAQIAIELKLSQNEVERTLERVRRSLRAEIKRRGVGHD